MSSLPFSLPTASWFEASFPAPTAVQALGWPAIASGEHSLLLAPTGSGKTLAAFLVGIDRCVQLALDAPAGVRVLYVSPLKALVHDVERNLRAPLAGVQARVGAGGRVVAVDVRTGDTSQQARRAFLKKPADILVTTPESLYLLLTSGARDSLRTVHTVIIDEIHALAPSKRGVHLALSLERLQAVAEGPVQRIGLSATVRPIQDVASFLGGPGRDVRVVDAAAPPRVNLQVRVPVADMERPVGLAPVDPDDDGLAGSLEQRPRTLQSSVWPSVHQEILGLIREHRTTIVFANSRLLTERLCAALNELAGEEIAMAHHGSISHARRGVVEDALKSGRIPCIVATSSLELGIDMGAVDLVVQVESPGSSARGLQRVGRAGHQVGAVSEGRIFPKFRGDLLESVVVAERMGRGVLEPVHTPARCLDVLAQQVTAMVAMDEGITVDAVFERVRGAWPYRDLSHEAFTATLDMLAGHYPSDAMADLSPRLVWDRTDGTLRPRKGARMLAVLNGGTIADRGLYGVFLADGPRIGELDEEMVYETRVGDTLILGASTWRVVEITRDRVLVAPAPGEPGRMPFWRGEGPGRPIDLGQALGAFVRELTDVPTEARPDWLRSRVNLDDHAVTNLLAYLQDQREATGTLPTDRAITVECFRDEIGDWRVCVLTPFGARVHAPWGLAIRHTLSRATGFEVQCMWTDDGIVLRFADADELPDLTGLFPDPDQVEDLVTTELRHSALFSSRFREAAARALLLPRKRPGRRTPLWAQRRRGETLLASVARFPAFPILLEAYRECLQDVFDLPALIGILRGVQDRSVRVDTVQTRSASPFARSLVFAWVNTFLYEVDTPLAERKAAALTLDRDLLRQLLGHGALRDLLDADAIARVEDELQRRASDWQAHDEDTLHDVLRRVGDLTEAALQERCTRPDDVPAWLHALHRSARAAPVRIAGEERWIAAADAGRYRDALGVPPPPGLPVELLDPVEDPLRGLLLRHARTHGPFTRAEVAARYALPVDVVGVLLDALVADGEVERGALRPGGVGEEYCHAEVLRRIKRASLAALRDEVAAVDDAALARFLPSWQGLSGRRRDGLDRLREVIAQLEGLALPASVWLDHVLPDRVPGFRSEHLDQLGAMGELVWIGRGALGPRDGRVALVRRQHAAAWLPEPSESPLPGRLQALLRDHLDQRGACFLAELAGLDPQATTTELHAALWDLVWAGQVTNDTFQPLRSLRSKPRKGTAFAGGRWELVARLAPRPASATERQVRFATALLERYGVVGREVVRFEELPGGFSGIYPVLRAMEEAGQVRRGFFVEGLGGAQFALPGAVDRLRALRDDEEEVPQVLAATDPSQVWGGVLSWPPATSESARPRRVAGAWVVLQGGRPVLFLDKGGRTAWTFTEDPARIQAAARALGQSQAALRGRRQRLDTLDGVPVRETSAFASFQRAGWAADHRGLEFVRGAP